MCVPRQAGHHGLHGQLGACVADAVPTGKADDGSDLLQGDDRHGALSAQGVLASINADMHSPGWPVTQCVHACVCIAKIGLDSCLG